MTRNTSSRPVLPRLGFAARTQRATSRGLKVMPYGMRDRDESLALLFLQIGEILARLNDENLPSINVKNGTFTKLDFAGIIGGCVLDHAKMDRNVVSSAAENRRAKEIVNKLLNGANFHGSDFSGANLSGLTINNANFENCIFSGANLADAKISGSALAADFREALFTEATDLSGVDTSNAQFTEGQRLPTEERPAAPDHRAFQH